MCSRQEPGVARQEAMHDEMGAALERFGYGPEPADRLAAARVDA